MSYSVQNTSLNSSNSNPFFSTIVTLYALIFLYFPIKFLFSPILFLTFALFLSLLRLGADQQPDEISSSPNELEKADQNTQKRLRIADETESSVVEEEEEHEHDDGPDDWSETDSDPETGPEPSSGLEVSFVQWNLRAPLEVIYEEEDEDEEGDRNYAKSESDESSSESDLSGNGFWESPENLRFVKWEEEDRDDGLIEIALGLGLGLNGEKNNEIDEKSDDCKMKKRFVDFHVDEDNLIEIDIS